MKKILLFGLLLTMLAGFNLSYGQAATRLPFHAQDTLNTTSSKDTVEKIITVTANYPGFAIQVNATKISGTVSAKAYLYGSLDGTNYTATDSSSAFADGSNYIWFTKTSTPYNFYKLQVRNDVGANTTQKVLVRTYFTARK